MPKTKKPATTMRKCRRQTIKATRDTIEVVMKVTKMTQTLYALLSFVVLLYAAVTQIVLTMSSQLTHRM